MKVQDVKQGMKVWTPSGRMAEVVRRVRVSYAPNHFELRYLDKDLGAVNLAASLLHPVVPPDSTR